MSFPKSVGAALCGILTLSLVLAIPVPGNAADAQTFLNTPAWQVDYEMTFTASGKGSSNSLHGPTEYTFSLERVHTAAFSVDLRSMGPNISMLRSAASRDMSKMSVAEQQKFAMEMMSKTEHTANWMHGGAALLENATDEEISAAILAELTTPNGSGHINFEQIVTGDNLHDETGAKYSSRSRTTRTGTANIIGQTQIQIEIDDAAKTYLFTLSTGFGDVGVDSVIEETTTHTQYEGAAATDTTWSKKFTLSNFPDRIVVDDSLVAFGAELILEGTFDPSADKIIGERTVNAHFERYGEPVPGTLLIKYTLTPK